MLRYGTQIRTATSGCDPEHYHRADRRKKKYHGRHYTLRLRGSSQRFPTIQL
jgi:hypothetical protein